MPAPKLTVPKTYAELRRGVETALHEGQQAVELARLRTYWETGRLINAHVLHHRGRADYGAQVLVRLADELNTAKTTLYQCTLFARQFPIFRARGKLGWAHYRVLLAVPDPREREALITQALEHAWTSRQLELHVYSQPTTTQSAELNHTAPPKLLTPRRGTPDIFRIVKRDDTLAVDLGFKLYVELHDAEADEIGAGGFVRFDARGRVVAADGASKGDLFTYAATVRRVVDGDTLEIEVKLPRGFVHVMKLRLRGIDCPEMDTAAGKAAKRYVEALLADSRDATIYTTKPDKYDRYLADVFIPAGGSSDDEDVFLNNALLRDGHAVRKDEYSLADWEA